jgi:hypothetical protein
MNPMIIGSYWRQTGGLYEDIDVSVQEPFQEHRLSPIVSVHGVHEERVSKRGGRPWCTNTYTDAPTAKGEGHVLIGEILKNWP